MWWRRQPTSHAPLARCAHAADCVDGRLYVFGGWSETRLFNDLHAYDPDNQMWTKLQDDKIDPNAFPCRSGHSTTSVGKKLLIFGGGSANETSSNIFMNDIFFFDTESMKWQAGYAKGVLPSGRTKHTATLIGSKLFVFGGGDGSRLYNDLYCLDLDSMTWSLLSCRGTPPCPRWGHSAVQVGNQLVVFGGYDGFNRLGDVHIFDTDTSTWREEACTRRSPGEVVSPCAGHTATMIGPHMLVIGGGDGHVLPAMYALNTSNWQWWWAGSAPGICAHTTTLVGNKLIAFGGGDGAYCFNDLYAFDVDKLDELYQSAPTNLKLASPSKHPQVQTSSVPLLSTSPPKNIRPPNALKSPRSAPTPSLQTSPPRQTPSTTTPAALPSPPSTLASPSATLPSPPSTSSSSASIPTTPPLPHNAPPAGPSTSLPQPIPPPATPSSPPPAHPPPAVPTINGFFNASTDNGNSRPQPAPPGSPVRSRRNSKSRSNNPTPTGTPASTPPASPRDQTSHPNGNTAGKGPNGGGGNAAANGNGNEQQPTGRSRRNSRARDKPLSLAKWLTGLGMSKYHEKFVAQEIDIDILDMVNEGHLKQLGIPLGDRLRICAAISKLFDPNKTM